jgi:ketosteroid isomerase-like protein
MSGTPVHSGETPIRAAEVVGALSLATDLGTGQPLEHALRTAVLAVRLGELAFTSEDGKVIGLHHNSGERNGRKLDTGCCIVFEIANGRMISGREHFFSLDNWDEFWS